jgi:hypothetical protein
MIPLSSAAAGEGWRSGGGKTAENKMNYMVETESALPGSLIQLPVKGVPADTEFAGRRRIIPAAFLNCLADCRQFHPAQIV